MKRTTPDQLDTVYNRWRALRFNTYYHYSYQRMSRHRHNNEFEDWLFEHGGIVKQENRKRFIQFDDDDKWFEFVLKWT